MLFRSKAAVPNVTQVMQQNPGLMRNMVDAVQRTSPFGAGPAAEQPPTPGLRREMRGPGMDFGSLMNMMGPPPPQMTRPSRPDDVESVSDIVSIDAGDQDTREVPVAKGRGRKTKKREVAI